MREVLIGNIVLGKLKKLFDLIIEEGFSAKDAVLVTGINIRTAQNYKKERRMVRK